MRPEPAAILLLGLMAGLSLLPGRGATEERIVGDGGLDAAVPSPEWTQFSREIGALLGGDGGRRHDPVAVLGEQVLVGPYLWRLLHREVAMGEFLFKRPMVVNAVVAPGEQQAGGSMLLMGSVFEGQEETERLLDVMRAQYGSFVGVRIRAALPDEAGLRERLFELPEGGLALVLVLGERRLYVEQIRGEAKTFTWIDSLDEAAWPPLRGLSAEAVPGEEGLGLRIASDMVACVMGDAVKEAENCYRLAVRHAEGVGVLPDRIWALRFMAEACEGGYPDACFQTGVGRANFDDWQGATEAFTRGCAGDELRSCLGLARQVLGGYAEGEASLELLTAPLAQACVGGEQDNACYAFISLIALGADAPAPKIMVRALNKRCTPNNPLLCYDAARAMVDKQQERLVVKWLERACSGRIAEACMDLGELYENGRGRVRPSSKRADKAWSKACRLGNEQACARTR